LDDPFSSHAIFALPGVSCKNVRGGSPSHTILQGLVFPPSR
jgi:hypothetical protein